MKMNGAARGLNSKIKRGSFSFSVYTTLGESFCRILPQGFPTHVIKVKKSMDVRTSSYSMIRPNRMCRREGF